MLKRISVLVAGITLGVSAMAIGFNHDAHVQQMAEQLGLDAEQTTQFTTIMDEMRAQHQQQRQQMREQMQALRDETDQKLASVLSDDQLQQLQTLRQQHREDMKPRHGHGKHGGMGPGTFCPNAE